MQRSAQERKGAQRIIKKHKDHNKAQRSAKKRIGALRRAKIYSDTEKIQDNFFVQVSPPRDNGMQIVVGLKKRLC